VRVSLCVGVGGYVKVPSGIDIVGDQVCVSLSVCVCVLCFCVCHIV
jgi:hypothetical protein